jgi:AcrR family transcriptional regulator
MLPAAARAASLVRSETSEAPAATSLRERKKQRTRERLYDAALELLAEKPYDAVSIDDICARADVGRATFFRFYGTKAGLLVEFNRRLSERARRARADDRGRSAAERLRIVQRAIAETWASSGPAMQQMCREFIRSTSVAGSGVKSHPELLALVSEIVRDGQRAGELLEVLPPDLLSSIITNALSVVTIRWFGSNDPLALERTTRSALDLVLTGLLRDRRAARPATQPRARRQRRTR